MFFKLQWNQYRKALIYFNPEHKLFLIYQIERFENSEFTIAINYRLSNQNSFHYLKSRFIDFNDENIVNRNRNLEKKP